MKRQRKKGRPRCPKCRSKKTTLTENWKNHTIEWTSDTPFSEGNLEAGEPFEVYAKCEICRHCWKVRGVIQISEDMFEI